MIRHFGGCKDDYLPEVEIWPCFEAEFDFFTSLSTQWRHGFGGAYGLDYNVIPFMAAAHGVTVDSYFMDDIRTMEVAALKTIHAKDNE